MPDMTETEQYLQMMNERDTDYLNSQEPLDMNETQSYLQMMDQRNTDYLNSINESQIMLPGAGGGGVYNQPQMTAQVMPDSGPRLQQQNMLPGAGGSGLTPLPQPQAARPRPEI